MRSGTTWTQQAKLTASDGVAGELFGFSVSISGQYVIVGMPNDFIGANFGQGSAYAFVRSGTTWTQQAKLTALDGADGDQFGYAVSINGDYAVVGSVEDDIGANASQGSAYVFVRSGTSWTQQAKLTASDGAAGELFGISVSISGSSAIVGAYNDNIGANTGQGSAYVFVRSGTTWTQQAKLTASDGAAGDRFGISVSINGLYAIVGASTDDLGANTAQGSAYLFVRSGTNWTQQVKLTASDGASVDSFGSSVGINGNYAIVGAEGAGNNKGAAYVFALSGTTWSQQTKIIASDGVTADFFGVSVGISGNYVIIGAIRDDIGPNVDQGSAYIIKRN